MNTSLRAFAKRLKVSHQAVAKAIARGRLAKSVGTTPAGKPTIIDVDVALREWSENAAKPVKSGNRISLSEAQGRVAFERARGLQLANEEKLKRLIPIDKAERTGFECARAIRDAMLNLPARLSAELAAETDPGKVHLRLDAEIRLALEAAAVRLADAG